MALVDSVDGPNRRIYLSAASVGQDVHPIDIYKEVRELRRIDESLRKFDTFLTGAGYVSKGEGKYTERYVVCNAGCRIVPYDTDHNLSIVGTIITDDGLSGIDCFDRTPLTPTTIVDISYAPPQVEVITIETAGGLTSGNIDSIVANVVAAIPDAVWDELSASHETAGTFGLKIKKLLTASQFLALK